MDFFKKKILERVTRQGETAQISKAEFYKRASLIYFNKTELKIALKELITEGNVELASKNSGLLLIKEAKDNSQVLKYPIRGKLLRW